MTAIAHLGNRSNMRITKEAIVLNLVNHELHTSHLQHTLYSRELVIMSFTNFGVMVVA